jgi:hypothetical protein
VIRNRAELVARQEEMRQRNYDEQHEHDRILAEVLEYEAQARNWEQFRAEFFSLCKRHNIPDVELKWFQIRTYQLSQFERDWALVRATSTRVKGGKILYNDLRRFLPKRA